AGLVLKSTEPVDYAHSSAHVAPETPLRSEPPAVRKTASAPAPRPRVDRPARRPAVAPRGDDRVDESPEPAAHDEAWSRVPTRWAPSGFTRGLPVARATAD